MVISAVLFGFGFWFVCLAAWFASQQVTRSVYTHRTFSDFSGDVAAWLRSRSE